MELIKGDGDNLEGRVIIYSKLSMASDDMASKYNKMFRDGQIFYIYASTDAAEFSQRTGIDMMLFEKVQRCMSIHDEEIKPMTFIYNGITDSEDELLAGTEDIIFVGEYTTPSSCMIAAEDAFEFYMVNFEEQWHEGQRLLSYKDLAGTTIEKHIRSYFISPYARANGAEKKGIEQALLEFSKGSGFFDDVKALCRVLESKDKNRDYLTDAYLEKITAIHNENYEHAARIRDKISALK